MKNFTNNFKQFTSRLSARWLIMTLMLLLGTSSAWAKYTIYYVNVNGWANPYCYAWILNGSSEATWPGKLMTKTGEKCLGYDVYKYDGTNDSSNRCIFSNKGANQTGDLTMNKGKYYYNGTWYSSISEIEEAATLPFLMGTLTDWDKGVKMTSSSSNVYTCTVNLTSSSTNYEFKIKYQDKWYGNNGEITSSISGWVFVENVNNCRLKANKDGDYTFTFNTSDKKVSVTFPPDCIAEKDVTPGEINVKPANNKYCAGEDYQLSINPTAIGGYTTTIQWQKKDGNDYSNVGENTSLKLENLAAGIYTYRATVTWTKGSCTVTESTADKSFTVNALPNAPTFNTAPSYCAGDNITLPTKDKAKNNVTWYKEDGTEAGTPANTAGTYTYKAKATNSNGCVSSTFGTYSYTVKSIPAKANFKYTAPTNLEFDNSAKTATVEWADSNNKGGAITVYYSSTTGSYKSATTVNVGTYYVFVKAEAGGNFCATTDYVEVGSFEITCNNNSAAQYTLNTAEFTYNGDKQVPTIKVGTGAGTVKKTTYMKNSVEVANPTAVGTYEVYITANAGTDYCAISNATKIGEFTIKCKEVTDINTLYSLSATSFPYNAYKQVPTINVADYAGTVATTTYKQGETQIDEPIEVGTYDVYITTNEGNGYCAITNETKVGSFTITCDKPVNPILSKTNVERCNGNVATYGTITITNFEQYESNYKFYLGGSEVTPTNEGVLGGIDFPGKDSEIYTVKVTNTCGATTLESDLVQITLTAEDITPVVGTLTLPEDFESCDGKSITIALQNWTAETGYTYQYTWESSADGNSYKIVTVGNNTTSLTRTLSGTTWYRVKVTKTGNGCTSPEATSNAVKVTALPVSKAAVSITAASYDMYSKKFSVTGVLNNAACSQDIYVGYQYKLSNDDTWKPLVNTHHLTGADAKDGAIFTKDDIEIANATPGQKYIFRAYAINGYPNYKESSAVYSSNTIEVEVKDGYTVYVRRPKNGEDIYTKWYELSSVKGGLSYVKSGAISGTGNNDNKATTNNTGGTEMSYAFTDCDGYTWDSFKPEEGQTKFYIHALNDDAQNGWATFSQTATITSGQDNYFILSSWNNQYGVPITSTNQPTLGITIKALGSKEVISTNMASFAALYLYGNCTGKDFPRDADGVPTNCFQWKYSSDNGAKWSDYSGAGAKWNNIRPTAAGSYKLVCTMNDNTTAESDTIKITTKSVTYADSKLINIESALPIIMVNTGDNKGFPGCSVAGNDYPSKHADAFKEKLSVDVKIKVGDEIVYDKKARMNYRGSSSLNFKKKSYAFCPGADMCGVDEDKTSDFVDTKKMDMLSLITKGAKTSAKDKDWVLYAATPDPSMMRNILAMETFSAMTGNWGVKNQYVELYVDGEYQGVYVFMDKITQNKDRVDITWNVDGSSKEFIVKFDKTDYADRYEFTNGDQKTFESSLGTGNTGAFSYDTEIDQRFEIEYPEKKDIIKKGGSWDEVYSFAKGKIDAFETALKDGDFNTVRSIIDYKSWADFFILTEFAKNGDGFRASCVFVYEDDLLRAYPLWDYELSFDNETRQEHDVDKTTGLLVNSTTYSRVNGSGNNGTFPAPFWWTGNYYNNKQYKGLLDDPCFISMVNARWEEHTKEGGALSKVKLEALVSKYNTALTTADATTNKVGGVTLNTPQKREAQKWPYDGATRGKTCNDKTIGYYGQGAGNAISEVEDFSASKSTLDTWIGDGDTGRRKGLKSEIDKLLEDVEFAITVVADKTTTTPWRPVTITVNSNSGYEYSVEPKPAKIEENGHIYTLYFARPAGTEGSNFTTVPEAYIFKATTGQADQCGTTEGSTTADDVKINLEDVVENCQ